MKNTKELLPVLTAIYVINRTKEQPDDDIENILGYAFRRIFNANTNLLLLASIGQTKETMMPQVTELLKKETKYLKYLEEIKK